MRKYFYIGIILISGFSVFSQGQRTGGYRRVEYKDSCHHFIIVGANITGELPLGDMQHRFGSNLSFGLPVLYKTNKNLLFGLDGNYFFSGNVKEDPLNSMYNSSNTITGSSGNPGAVRLNERGFTAYAVIGTVINKFGKNKNSGIFVYVGLGYMQHKINIYDINKSLPQITGNLAKGYDRLTGGPAAEQFIGYMYLARNRMVNFYTGFEIQEGFTTGLRGYQYDTMASDGKQRWDILVGFKFGWLLPLYTKAPKEFYYN
ncbi:MAG TPA: hypothetical protein VF411_15115 [Bacteroidia bacterium]